MFSLISCSSDAVKMINTHEPLSWTPLSFATPEKVSINRVSPSQSLSSDLSHSIPTDSVRGIIIDTDSLNVPYS